MKRYYKGTLEITYIPGEVKILNVYEPMFQALFHVDGGNIMVIKTEESSSAWEMFKRWSHLAKKSRP